METLQRLVRPIHDDDMTTPDSAFSLPEGKEKISARVASLVKKKLLATVEIWQANTRLEKERRCALEKLSPADTKRVVEDAVNDVDLTYVIDKLLGKAVDVELAQWGGYPETPEKLAAVVKGIAQSKK